MQSEADLQRDILAWLTIHRIMHWRMPVGAVMHRKKLKGQIREFYKPSPLKGFPDIAGVLSKQHPGTFFVLELKSQKGKLTPEQKIWIAQLSQAGAKTAVIRSLDDIIENMTRWGEI